MKHETNSVPIRRLTVVNSIPASFLILSVLALCLIQLTDFSLTGRPLWELYWSLLVANLAGYVSLRMSRLGLGRQAIITLLAVATEAFLFWALRIDGFLGDGRPMLAWRWTATADEAWALSQNYSPSSDVGGPRGAGSSSPTPFDWPGFRGPNRDGVVIGPALSRDWQAAPKRLWRRAVGPGWSSFAVVGDFCVTQEQRGEYEVVVCYELRTGDAVWVHRDRASFAEVTGGNGPRSTPAIADGRVFSLGATGILNCLDAHSGMTIWSTNILHDSDVENRIFGMSGSPLLLDRLVIVSPGGPGSSLVAYDQGTGRRAWHGGDAKTSYSSPHLAPFERPQLLNFNADGLSAHDPQTGAVYWNYPWVSNPAERNNVCQPVPLPGRNGQADQVFIASGYGQGCALLEVKRIGHAFTVSPQWKNSNLRAKFSSVVVRNGHVYGLDERILVCLDLATGDRRWKSGRYGHGQLILAGDLLILQAESGDVALVEATPQGHQEVGRFRALDGRTWNHPVVTGQLLLVRNDREAACYELPLRN